MHILLLLPIVLLSGCMAPPLIVTGLGIGSVAVNETTGKNLTDHTVSAVNGQDCRVFRIFQDRDICQNSQPNVNLQSVSTGVTPSSTQEIESRYR